MSRTGWWSVLAVLWLGLVGAGVADACATGAPGFTAFGGPEQLDATGQMSSRGFESSAADADAVWLQVAMLRLAERGTENALLCAGQAPAHEQPRELVVRFRDVRTFRHPDNLPDLMRIARRRVAASNEARAVRFGVLPPGFAARSVLWRATFHRVDSERGAAIELPEGSLLDIFPDAESLPAMRCEPGSPLAISWGPGLVLLARLANGPADEAQLATREWWHDRFVADRDTLPESLLTAAYAFVDPGLAGRVADEHGEWLQARDSLEAKMLSGRWPEHLRAGGTYPRGYLAWADRAIELCTDDVQRARLVAKLPPEPGPSGGDVCTLLLVALLAVVAACGRRRAAVPPPTVSRVGLLVLWICFDFAFPPLSWLYAAVLLVAWRLRMPTGAAPLQRIVFAVAFAGALGYSLRVGGWLPDLAWLDTFVVLGRTGAWLLIGAWLAQESARRARWLYAAFLLALVGRQGAASLHWLAVPPWVTLAIWSAAAGLCFWLLLAFCVFGELRRAPREPAPTLATT